MLVFDSIIQFLILLLSLGSYQDREGIKKMNTAVLNKIRERYQSSWRKEIFHAVGWIKGRLLLANRREMQWKERFSRANLSQIQTVKSGELWLITTPHSWTNVRVHYHYQSQVQSHILSHSMLCFQWITHSREKTVQWWTLLSEDLESSQSSATHYCCFEQEI